MLDPCHYLCLTSFCWSCLTWARIIVLQLIIALTLWLHTCRLVDNPYCEEGESGSKYCTIPQQSSDTMYSIPTPNCSNSVCPLDQDMDSLCSCSCPYRGTIYFLFQNFSDINNPSHYFSLVTSLYKGCLEYQVPVSSVSVLNPYMNNDRYLQIDLKLFPARKVYFDESEVFLISSLFNNRNFNVPPEFGSYSFRGKQYIFQGNCRYNRSWFPPNCYIQQI